MTKGDHDIVVVGLGVMGASTLMHLAGAGADVVGIDQYAPPHDVGSSHGESRVTREAIGEGGAYIPLIRRSHQLWKELEAEAGVEIFKQTGCIMLDPVDQVFATHGVDGFTEKTVELAKRYGVAHDVLSGAEASDRFPRFEIPPASTVYLEPGAGLLRPENAVQAMLDEARRAGAKIRTEVRVQSIQARGDGVELTTSAGCITARQCVLTVGPWIREFLPPDTGSLFKVCRQVVHWLPVNDLAPDEPMFIWGFGKNAEDVIYGFPSLDGKPMKVASECYLDAGKPDDIQRTVSLVEQEAFMQEKVAGRLRGVAAMPSRSEVCIYTVAPQSRFIIDAHPTLPNTQVVSACSGHGFKHAPAIGEAVAARMLGKTSQVSLDAFSWPAG